MIYNPHTTRGGDKCYVSGERCEDFVDEHHICKACGREIEC